MKGLEELKDKIHEILPDLDLVIGWEQGYDGLHATPLFIKTPEDVDRLIIGPLCVHNLATYLPGLKDKKVGVIVKGCDSRAVIELLQEKLINKDNVVILGLTCDGVINLTKLGRKIGSLGAVDDVKVEGEKLNVVIGDQQHNIAFSEVKQDKCENCIYPNALVFDHFIGEPVDRVENVGAEHQSLSDFEGKSFDQRFAFWKHEMSRCIRCHACRNACPMCVCRDHCVAMTRNPHWLSQENNVAENWMFQMIHVMHLTGRCVECGECERACPMDIPLMLLRRQMNRGVREVFDYEAGIDAQNRPPLLTFKVEEDNISEREW
ncbi:4Fe-4S dicluster domain-containing protein [Desulforhopalus singaporensis]|uniref:4Fe-4S dicluster domain-containing protein n=1 Tax=Desulforhopalus singaporensis TaxID=91360 RepID=A0A1H0SQ83_9BACT|nr:4Fe-4S dicluster domain-containing protein [Desulforhopalus singaporensis]SDP43917.1 4Fe-4S dicluster domain-containing protein [Desulforhopalus singaporensis]